MRKVSRFGRSSLLREELRKGDQRDIPHFPCPLSTAPGEAAFGEEEQMPVFETQQSASLVQPFQFDEGYGIVSPLAFPKDGILLVRGHDIDFRFALIEIGRASCRERV